MSILQLSPSAVFRPLPKVTLRDPLGILYIGDAVTGDASGGVMQIQATLTGDRAYILDEFSAFVNDGSTARPVMFTVLSGVDSGTGIVRVNETRSATVVPNAGQATRFGGYHMPLLADKGQSVQLSLQASNVTGLTMAMYCLLKVYDRNIFRDVSFSEFHFMNR